MRYIGVDVGGHTITAGEVSFSARPRVVRAETVDTPSCRSLEPLLGTLRSLILRYAAPGDECCVGLGLPGFVSKDRKSVTRLTNFHGCEGLAVGELLERDLHDVNITADVFLENDANCAALGEGAAGAAYGLEDYVVITLGTGIGAGIVSGGELLRGAHGMAAECGHMALCGTELHSCGCGGAGHWEEAASADWLERRAAEAGLPADFKKLWGIREEKRVSALLEPALETTARGIASLAAALDPETVIISGGMSRAAGIAEELSSRARKYLPAPYLPYFSLRVSGLGGDAAVIGAASLGI